MHPLNRLILLTIPFLVAACGKVTDGAQAATKNGTPPLLLAAEDLHTVRNSALTSGPSITGSIQPERRADLRAEVPAMVMKVYKENGDTVHHGDLLVTLDSMAIHDALDVGGGGCARRRPGARPGAAPVRARQGAPHFRAWPPRSNTTTRKAGAIPR